MSNRLIRIQDTDTTRLFFTAMLICRVSNEPFEMLEDSDERIPQSETLTDVVQKGITLQIGGEKGISDNDLDVLLAAGTILQQALALDVAIRDKIAKEYPESEIVEVALLHKIVDILHEKRLLDE